MSRLVTRVARTRVNCCNAQDDRGAASEDEIFGGHYFSPLLFPWRLARHCGGTKERGSKFLGTVFFRSQLNYAHSCRRQDDGSARPRQVDMFVSVKSQGWSALAARSISAMTIFSSRTSRASQRQRSFDHRRISVPSAASVRPATTTHIGRSANRMDAPRRPRRASSKTHRFRPGFRIRRTARSLR